MGDGFDKCTCPQCPMCEGNGHYYVDMRGHYLHHGRRDDMDEMETCEECGGSGIEYECDYCMDMRDAD